MTVLLTIAALSNIPKTLKKLTLARQRLGSWKEVGRRTAKIVASEGVFRALSRGRRFGSEPGSGIAVIRGRREALERDIAKRLSSDTSAEAASAGPLISIIMPVYKTPLPLLERTFRSVRTQTASNWELCVVDDGSDQPGLADWLRRQAATDGRIKVHISPNNLGIASASNVAIGLASGEFVGFLDHDDMLTCDAIASVSEVLRTDPAADIVYSDECKIDDNDQPHDIFLKPDWSPALLLNAMYIGHFTVYRRSLISQVGGLRSDYDLSQDYDLALRATEVTQNIRHIEKVLYGWRMISGSAAVGDKPHARQTNIAALQNAIRRRGYQAEAEALPAANHVRWNRDAMEGMVSIIIPSDNAAFINDSIQSICAHTTWLDYEILVVTRSSIMELLASQSSDARVRFVAYNRPYNFSDKCNAGADAALGRYLIFYNDDVRVISAEWIEALLEALLMEGVGAVSPKLLYENETIQHAGLVTGVRGIIGTAFHTLPATSGAYFNFAQSLRDVSSLSGACLAIHADLFHQIGGYDHSNTPIAHSDVDICFRIWEAGFRCVYTPYATLLHIGHQSLANYDKALVADQTYKKDKATIYLLKRWPIWIARDPYYPLGMKALLYIDSPEDFDIFPGKPARCRRDGRDILILTHELTNSGAPLVVYGIVRELINDGHFVTVMSPADGYYRELLVAEGATVIIDALLLKGHESLPRFARDFDKVIANTVVPWTAVLQLADQVDVYWYIHESKVIAKNYSIQPGFSKALHRARSVWAVSERTRQQLAHVGREIEVVEIGIQPPGQPRVAPASDGVTRFTIIGSYEDRKGQDLVVAALKMLPDDVRRQCRFQFYGRPVDPVFYSNLAAACQDVAEVNLDGELSHDDCLEAIQASHVVICPSRDDALNIVALEALATGKPLLCTKAAGIADYLAHGESAFLVDALSPKAIAGGILECLASKDAWPKIAGNGREVFRTYFSRDAFAARLKEKLFASDTIPVA